MKKRIKRIYLFSSIYLISPCVLSSFIRFSTRARKFNLEKTSNLINLAGVTLGPDINIEISHHFALEEFQLMLLF